MLSLLAARASPEKAEDKVGGGGGELLAPFPRKRAFRAKNEGYSSDAAKLQNSTMEFELPTQTLIIYRFEKLLVPRQPFSSR